MIKYGYKGLSKIRNNIQSEELKEGSVKQSMKKQNMKTLSRKCKNSTLKS